MDLPFRQLPAVLACCCFPAWATPSGQLIRVGDERRLELRNAVEAHRASQREDVRREESVAGRRLTPAELAELRQQVRGQWSPRPAPGSAPSPEPQSAERFMPRFEPPRAGVPPPVVAPAPRLQRP